MVFVLGGEVMVNPAEMNVAEMLRLLRGGVNRDSIDDTEAVMNFAAHYIETLQAVALAEINAARKNFNHPPVESWKPN